MSQTTTKACKACKELINAEAKICPHCRTKQGMGFLKKMVIGFVGLLVIGAFMQGMTSKTKTPLTPEQLAAEKERKEANERQYKRIRDARHAIDDLKSRMKNPDSFKAEAIGVDSNGNVCIQYRAANSFNAIIPGVAVYTDKLASTDPQTFKKHCKGPFITLSPDIF